ncbi:hypothetical protein [Streptomyces sp. NPDC057909]|uniref:hypothetical protein n=1 Tax=Streptomyces sp. NPDC057909 TaxID=3346277 RepID=UPI0036E774D2
MNAKMNADDLRALATALDQMTRATRETGVRIAGYQEQYVRIGEHQLAIDWVPEADTKDDKAGQYTIEISDSTY